MILNHNPPSHPITYLWSLAILQAIIERMGSDLMTDKQRKKSFTTITKLICIRIAEVSGHPEKYDERSRSGGGFMLPTGGAFRVAPEFAGTPGDNFITRAIIANQNNISNIIRTEFGKLL